MGYIIYYGLVFVLLCAGIGVNKDPLLTKIVLGIITIIVAVAFCFLLADYIYNKIKE